MEVTPSRVHDCRLLPAPLDQIPGRIVQVSGDGAYDTRACYQSMRLLRPRSYSLRFRILYFVLYWRLIRLDFPAAMTLPP